MRWATALAPSVGVVATAALLTTGAALLGMDVPLPLTCCLTAVLAAMAALPVRSRLEAWTREGHAALSLLLGATVTGALLATLGLAVLVPAVCVSASSYAIRVVATRRQVVVCVAVTLLVSTACLGAQLLGWVPGIVPAGAAAVVGYGLLAATGATLFQSADTALRAQEAAQVLEAAQREHLATMEHLSRHDELTGLLSRRGVVGALRGAAASASPQTPVAVVFLDLDGFKAVNDTHGHAAGDELLLAVARRLRRSVRPTDAVARLGGDEFVVVVEPGSFADVTATAERLHEQVTREVTLSSGARVRVGVSVGVSTATSPVEAEQLLAEADTAMYAVKRAAKTQAPSA